VQMQQVILNLLLNAADAMTGTEDRPRTLRVETQIQWGQQYQADRAGLGRRP
jgi:C4-dicarboxylate-specific signal transduction histidine kinase